MKKIFFLIAVITSGLISAQCPNFHKMNCMRGSEETFHYNSQSKSGLFTPGMTSELKVVLYEGMDYSISLCNDKILGKGEMKFTLKDAKTGEVIYDNTTDEGSQQIEFTCETTRNVLIRVTAPGAAAGGGSDVAKTGNKPAKSARAEDAGCVGVLIEQKPATKSGF